MASPEVDISHGATIVFGTSGFALQITDITGPGLSRESINVSHQESGKWELFTPGDVVDNGELTFNCHFKADEDPPMDAVAETVTITWPDAVTWAFSGFMTGYEPAAPHKEKQTVDVTVKVSGQITITADGTSQVA